VHFSKISKPKSPPESTMPCVCYFCLFEAMYIVFFIFGMDEILSQTIKASHILISAIHNNVARGRGCDREDNVRSKGILLMS